MTSIIGKVKKILAKVGPGPTSSTRPGRYYPSSYVYVCLIESSSPGDCPDGLEAWTDDDRPHCRRR
jgi:hypothetical protein